MAACAENLTPVLIEAGGKDALLVAEDADIEAAADAAAWGAFSNAGQTCAGVERVYVHEDVHDDFVERFVNDSWEALSVWAVRLDRINARHRQARRLVAVQRT